MSREVIQYLLKLADLQSIEGTSFNKCWLIYKVAMVFWINIYGCQPYPRHGPLSVNQLKNDSYSFIFFYQNDSVNQQKLGTICI